MSETALQRTGEHSVAVFDPGLIDLSLLRDLPGTLRALADAIETGQLAAMEPRADGLGGPLHDPRAHVRVSFVVAAAVFPNGVFGGVA